MITVTICTTAQLELRQLNLVSHNMTTKFVMLFPAGPNNHCKKFEFCQILLTDWLTFIKLSSVLQTCFVLDCVWRDRRGSSVQVSLRTKAKRNPAKLASGHKPSPTVMVGETNKNKAKM